METGFPHACAGQAIGLLGGSFDPAHTGHVHVTLQALARFGLDRIWWLVSPGNPLKAHRPAAPSRRLAQARALMRHPRVRVIDLERRLGTRHTAHTVAMLQRRYRGVRFVWLMGADNLAHLHRWTHWETIVARVPLGVMDRPEARLAACACRAARRYAMARVRGCDAAALKYRHPPAWCLVKGPLRGETSSSIRAAGAW